MIAASSLITLIILAKYIPKFLIFVFFVQFIIFLHDNSPLISNHIYKQICFASGYYMRAVSC